MVGIAVSTDALHEGILKEHDHASPLILDGQGSRRRFEGDWIAF
jgi:hypothetical protein